MAKFVFFELLRYFCARNAMSFVLFFCAIWAKQEIFFLRKLSMKRNFSFAQFFCAICAKPQVLCKKNFLGKLSKIDILSLELNN